MRRVENGDCIKVRFVARTENGDTAEATEGCEPVEIRVGAGEVVQGFENALIGMASKEKKTFTVPPEQGYGERDERLRRTILRLNFPPDFEPREGDVIAMQTAKGEQLPAMVISADKENVTIDFNHPLAGQTLTYEVEVAEIMDKPAD